MLKVVKKTQPLQQRFNNKITKEQFGNKWIIISIISVYFNIQYCCSRWNIVHLSYSVPWTLSIYPILFFPAPLSPYTDLWKNVFRFDQAEDLDFSCLTFQEECSNNLVMPEVQIAVVQTVNDFGRSCRHLGCHLNCHYIALMSERETASYAWFRTLLPQDLSISVNNRPENFWEN